MKKFKLALIIIISFAVGVAGTVFTISTYGTSGKGLIVVPESEYNTYLTFKRDYLELLSIKDFIKENYYIPVNEEDLKIGAYKGLFNGLNDPYSTYLTPKELADVNVQTQGEYTGVGVSIAPDDKGFINVVAPIEDTPAEKAGIKSGDKIIRIDGVEYFGENIDEAVSVMRGKPGTEVTLTILRGTNFMEFKLKRANVTLKTIKSEILDGNIGYIRITSFDGNTASDFNVALKALEAKKVSGFVLDIRSNPGGLVDESVKIADRLMGKGVIVYTQDRKGKKDQEISGETKTNLKFVVLVDEATASAAEILAGAIKDSKTAKLVGMKTFGKGIIQRITMLKSGAAVKLTVSQYFSPAGNVINKKGIEPDIKVEIKETDFVNNELPREKDRQLNEAIKLLKI